MLLDQETRERWLTTLNLCLGILPKDYAFHILRIEQLKDWLMGRTSSTAPNWQEYPLHWVKYQQQWQVETPHGTAIIMEQPMNGKVHYSIQVRDRTGLLLRDHFVANSDFATTEKRVRHLLAELETVEIDEAYLDHLGFTLHICQHLLPLNVSSKHQVHLNEIEQYLQQTLITRQRAYAAASAYL